MRPTPELIYEYRALRQKALRERDERRAAAFALVPRFAEIARERRRAAYSTGVLAMEGDEKGRLAALERVAELNAEEAELLKRCGYPADEFSPRFRCGLCGDTGYVGETQKRPCTCLLRRMAEEKYASSGISPDESFENFRQDIYPSDRQRKLALKARDICAKYAGDFPDQARKCLLLMGDTGLGKSYLLNAVALAVTRRGYAVCKTSAYNLINAAMESIRERTAPPDLISPDLAVIDDLGTEPMVNNITRETLFCVLNERQAAGKSTVWATNRGFEDIQDSYGVRFFSRLVAARSSAVLVLEGEDLRLTLK